jgi:uncharacterized protein
MKALLICCTTVIFLYSFTGSPAKQTNGITSVLPLKDTSPKYEMKQYWLTFLYKGTNRNHDSATSARIQAAHIANIERLAKEGKIIMAGPMGYNKDLRGIFIIDAKDSAQAASYVNTDSAIITGRLRFEVHPWWTAKGKYEFQ